MKGLYFLDSSRLRARRIHNFLDVNEIEMTATFKVVEFYRNNNTTTNNNINNSINTSNTTADDSPSSVNTKVDTTKLPPGLISSFNLIYGTLGFNVLGGYLTDIPATVIDVAVNASGKSAKV